MLQNCFYQVRSCWRILNLVYFLRNLLNLLFRSRFFSFRYLLIRLYWLLNLNMCRLLIHNLNFFLSWLNFFKNHARWLIRFTQHFLQSRVLLLFQMIINFLLWFSFLHFLYSLIKHLNFMLLSCNIII